MPAKYTIKSKQRQSQAQTRHVFPLQVSGRHRKQPVSISNNPHHLIHSTTHENTPENNNPRTIPVPSRDPRDAATPSRINPAPQRESRTTPRYKDRNTSPHWVYRDPLRGGVISNSIHCIHIVVTCGMSPLLAERIPRLGRVDVGRSSVKVVEKEGSLGKRIIIKLPGPPCVSVPLSSLFNPGSSPDFGGLRYVNLI